MLSCHLPAEGDSSWLLLLWPDWLPLWLADMFWGMWGFLAEELTFLVYIDSTARQETDPKKAGASALGYVYHNQKCTGPGIKMICFTSQLHGWANYVIYLKWIPGLSRIHVATLDVCLWDLPVTKNFPCRLHVADTSSCVLKISHSILAEATSLLGCSWWLRTAVV